MVALRCLFRARLPSLISQPSPASLYSNRLAVQVFEDNACCVYIASGTSTYQIKLLLGNEAIVGGDRNSFLGTTDSYGRIVVSRITTMGKGSTFNASPEDAGVGEGSWAGLEFVPGQPSLIAVCRNFAKSIDFYDQDMHIRTMHTLQNPTSMSFLDKKTSAYGSSSILAITEGPQISIWDLRVAENGGCVQRALGSSTLDPLYAVCTSFDGQLVGTGGAERTAVIFDRRKWTAISRWTNCIKYEITGVTFSDVDPSLLYLHGLDYEVVCGRWSNNSDDETRQQFAFRGDSRWLGLSKSISSDVIVGWCESGSIFAGEAL